MFEWYDFTESITIIYLLKDLQNNVTDMFDDNKRKWL